MIGLGAIANAAGIVIGGIAGLTMRKQASATTQAFFKVSLGAFTVYYGLRLAWLSLSGLSLQTVREILVVLVALMVGKVTGRLLRLQKSSNRLGRYAREQIAAVAARKKRQWSDGFNTCAVLFCAAPLAILGSIQDGLSDYFPPLVIKAVMDGLATMGFVAMFGWSVIVAALPVFVYEGMITALCALYARPFLEQCHCGLVESVNATGGLLVFCVALIIFEIKKIEIADYLPSLVFAPLLTWLLTKI